MQVDIPIPPGCEDVARFKAAIAQFDAANAEDPNRETLAGASRPRELVYAERLTGWVVRLAPRAGEVLLLASRCQHLRRWEIPRASHPQTRAGYLLWRSELKRFHAEKAGAILAEVGYPATSVEAVQSLNLKKNFPADPDSRVLEDALCLVFLQYQFADLAARTDEEKMINALRKSWNKMTDQARAEALKLNFGDKEAAFIARALGGGSGSRSASPG